MKKSTRALAGLVFLELFFLVGAIALIMMLWLGFLNSPEPAKAVATITSVAGGAMGITAGVLLTAYFVHRKNGN